MKPSPTPLLSMTGLSISSATQCLVSEISFTLHKGQCLGIVGESGSGKTLICRALLGLLPANLKASGRIVFEQTEMLTASLEERRRVLGTGMSIIMQQAMTAFDPLYSLGEQFGETLQEKLGLGREKALDLAKESLGKVKLPPSVLNSYPHQLSGGMLQRCMIALSLALRSRLLVADEPTTALDAKTQYEVLQRFQRLRKHDGLTLIFVSHDLGAVQLLADSLLVMRQGQCVEQGDATTIFNAPRHDYTQYLVRTRLALSQGFRRMLGASHA